ncbi:3-keto-disaccharide hydrolase [Bremerella sp. T1]|uniref:3-keto-disaccharide hydrolase n=1 Tax=Bremerella sp. TYQ1 TaxID=3119568 RepID=UPI001CCFEB71|nr:DUF1080 domain-containing protein [Bremerella volcania]UBM37460.1 DUF1080 domain-containing protein [Bremerella volcania]
MSMRIFLSLACCFGLASIACGQEFKSGIEWPEPRVVTPGEKPSDPPSDAIVLIGEDGMSAWNGGEKWKWDDGVATAAKGGINTKEKFGDIQLHMEWAAPEEVKSSGQGRGNSGVFFMGHYEVQILDSYENTTYFDGQAGAVYKQSPPMVNAMKKPGQWNTYDIVFNKPVRNEKGDVVAPARITVIHNGVVVQNSYPVRGSTNWHKPPAYDRHGDEGSISLQFHGNPVKFRNMWVRKIEPIEPTFVPEDTEMVRYRADWSTEKMTAAPPQESETEEKEAPKKEKKQSKKAEKQADKSPETEAKSDEKPAEKPKDDSKKEDKPE